MSPKAQLPTFKYHPDPVASGSFESDPEAECLSCGQARGYIYMGPVYTNQDVDIDEQICPWCIADGSAAKKFEAGFNDVGMIEGLPSEILDEIEERTPGFTSWEDPQWLTCCNDGAAFLGNAGAKELKRKFAEAAPVVKEFLRQEYDAIGSDLKELFDSLDKEDSPTAYVFQCLHCKKYLAYVDEV